jgi:hypothetical protein
MKGSNLIALAIGVLIIGVLTPLSQFLTILTINSAAETTTPVSWAVGFLVSFVLCGLVVRALSKRQLFNHQQLALIYTMLTIAVPLMNLGLVRQVYLASVSVLREYIYEGTSTYRTAYSALNEDWFPMVPTLEGLAWSKADRLIHLMANRDRLTEALAARGEVFDFLGQVHGHPEGLASVDAGEKARFHSAAEDLDLDGLSDVLTNENEPLLREMGLWEGLLAQRERLQARSAEALGRLPELLEGVDDWTARLLPRNLKEATLSAQQRTRRAVEEYLDAEREAELMDEVGRLSEVEARIREEMGWLSGSDANRLKQLLAQSFAEGLASLEEEALAFEREAHVFQLSRDERRRLYRQDGTDGPNMNLWAFNKTFWDDVGEQQVKEQAGFMHNLRFVWERLPWDLWVKPLMMWGLLITVFFLFILCLAELLRRRWVDRENLTFPLVEVADSVIRHDYDLEHTSDARHPEKRRTLFSPMFLMGAAAGFFLLFIEALYHYNLISIAPRLFFDFNEQIFNQVGGPLRSLEPIIFVVSPIVIGLAFLLSLEISFSIWVSYFIFVFLSWNIDLAFPGIRDSTYTGFSGGKNYPFIMEQMLGACICFAGYHCWRLFRKTGDAGHGGGGPSEARAGFLPDWLARGGVVVFPILALMLLWNLGVRNIPLLGFFFLFIFLQMVAAARLRAETGLPTSHVHYEMTKMPLVLGMTEATGSKVYASFLNVVFLPGTLLFRSLPTCLENLELARRLRLSYRTLMVGTLLAFFTALTVGGLSFLVFAYFWGEDFIGSRAFPAQSNPSSVGLATYPLWVAHFLGEEGLDAANKLNILRLSVIATGFGVTGLLILLRQRFLKFPLHPIGYLVILCSVYFHWCTQYVGVENKHYEASVLWGGVFLAWVIKKLILKYGGMLTYKTTKPLFVGMVVGSVFCIFFWNTLDLAASIWARQVDSPGTLLRAFTETIPYMPQLY